jgi:capsular exopolysaccharide synthesis family protein
LLVGLVLGIALAFIREGFDRRIKDIAGLEEVFGAPALVSIPDMSDVAATAEGFRALRAQLRYFNVDKRIRTVLVTSAVSGEGKTTVATHLASAAGALPYSRVLLIETDLRKADVAERLGIEKAPGLVQVLSGETDLRSAIRRPRALEGGADGGDDRLSFDVLVAGATPPNAAEMLESYSMSGLLAGASEEYDLIVIDTAPLLLVADAIPLMGCVSGVLAVASMGSTTGDSLLRLRRSLDQVDAPVLGLVVNRVTARDSGGGYGYGYGYRDSERPVPAAPEQQPGVVGVPSDRISA